MAQAPVRICRGRPGGRKVTLQARGRLAMRTFTFRVHDDRFDGPFEAQVTCRDEARARQIALEKLEDSTHILRIEVREGDAAVFTLPA
jgi:hypothetical protein